MSYVVYHKETTILLDRDKVYGSAAAAKGAITRAANRGDINADDYAIASKIDFLNNIEKMVTRKNLMTGELFEEPVNTPIYCSPAFESFWQM